MLPLVYGIAQPKNQLFCIVCNNYMFLSLDNFSIIFVILVHNLWDKYFLKWQFIDFFQDVRLSDCILFSQGMTYMCMKVGVRKHYLQKLEKFPEKCCCYHLLNTRSWLINCINITLYLLHMNRQSTGGSQPLF